MQDMPTKKEIMEWLESRKDITPIIRNRISSLIDAFNGNISQFSIATRGQIEGTYAKLHPEKPGEKSYGLGPATLRIFDEVAKFCKDKRFFENKKIEDETQERERQEKALQEERERIREKALADFLGTDICLKALSDAASSIAATGIGFYPLGDIVKLARAIEENKPDCQQ